MGNNRKTDWHYLLGKHKSLEPSFALVAGDVSDARCYLLTVNDVSVLRMPLRSYHKNASFTLELHFTLYFLEQKRFLGRTYRSKKYPLEERNYRFHLDIVLEEVVYFSTNVTSPDLHAVCELVIEEQGPLGGALYSLGFALLQLFPLAKPQRTVVYS